MYILQLISNSPVFAAVFIFSLVVAITVHEFAHAWTAYRLGDDTPYHQGRVTLNPAAHLDPAGSALFLLLGMGWGRPVQYNPYRLSKNVYELWIALAGPASNLILALIFNLAATLLTTSLPNLADILRFASNLNVSLAAFNMIPIPPLDGSSIIAYFWPEYRSIVGGQFGILIILALVFVSGGLIGMIISPIATAFSHLTTLFGLIG